MNKYCVVGLGKHAQSKIIPSILSSENELLAVVTQQKNLDIKNIKIFRNLEDSLKNLSNDIIFILSNPPNLHFEYAKEILNANFNLMIEKPIFLSKNEILQIDQLAKKNDKFYYECFMYQHCKLYEEFKSIYSNFNCKSIYIDFLIPEVPIGSYRSKNQFYSSLIYDIGCYPISLLNELGLTKKNLSIKKIFNKGDYEKENFIIKGQCKKISITINFGVGVEYKNQVKIEDKFKKEYTFDPFFYGRASKKTIEFSGIEKNTKNIISDNCAFTSMYSLSSDHIIKSYNSRRQIMLNNLEDIEALINQYQKY